MLIRFKNPLLKLLLMYHFQKKTKLLFTIQLTVFHKIHKSIKFNNKVFKHSIWSRISNNKFCVYFTNINIVNNIINHNPTITINNHNIDIRRLENQAKRIISNVSPIIPHLHIIDALSHIGMNTLKANNLFKIQFSNRRFIVIRYKPQ